MAASINRVVLVGNLTRTPELRHTPSGMPVCSLPRSQHAPQGRDRPVGREAQLLRVTVWGQQGENCAQYLAEGPPVACEGRLDWREWDTQDGQKRQAVEVVAESVQFLGSRGDGEGGAYVPAAAAAQASDADFAPSAADDDIPF